MSPRGLREPESVCAEVERGKPKQAEDRGMLVNRGSGSTPWSSDVTVTQTGTTDSPPHPRPNPLTCCRLLPLLFTTDETDCQKQGVKVSDIRVYSRTDLQLCVNTHSPYNCCAHK